MTLRWQKVTDCPNLPGCDCPEPSSPPSYVGQTAYTDCGGSGSSTSSSSSSDSTSSSTGWEWQQGENGCAEYGCTCPGPPNRPPAYNNEVVIYDYCVETEPPVCLLDWQCGWVGVFL